MRASDIETFFHELDRRIDFRVQAIITGGAAAAIFGAARATQDIDFEVRLKSPGRDAWAVLQKKLEEVEVVTKIAAQFSADIDRWSSIALPNKKSRLWRRIGKVEVRVLDPGLWAIGKLARYLVSDQTDLVTVLEQQRSAPKKLARLWGAALGSSPSSTAQSIFSRNVGRFFERHARVIWGKRADPAELNNLFLKSAQSARKK